MLLRHARIPVPASRLRNLATSSAIQTDKKELSANIGLFSSILHGSEQAKEEGETEVLQYSRLIGRNKYVHEMVTHTVKPDCRERYKKAAEEYYTKLARDPTFKVKLTGSWETLIGPLDNFVHILEYENYDGYDHAIGKLTTSKDLSHIMEKSILNAVNSRNSQLMSEFAFWPSSPPREYGGIYEMRSYQLQPGRLLEWENAWKRGIEARKRFVQPAGSWFAQVGALHEVHHLWQYPNLAERKSTREKAWNVSGWSDTVQEVNHPDIGKSEPCILTYRSVDGKARAINEVLGSTTLFLVTFALRQCSIETMCCLTIC